MLKGEPLGLTDRLQRHPVVIMIGLLSAAVSLVLAIEQLFTTPLSATGPEAHVRGLADTTQPFAPFYLENRSIIFPAR